MSRLKCECSAVLVDGLCPVCESVKLAARAARRLRAQQRDEERRAVRIDISRDAVIAAAHRLDPIQRHYGEKARERVARGLGKARAR